MLRIALDEGLEPLLRAGVVAILQVLEGVVIERLALGAAAAAGGRCAGGEVPASRRQESGAGVGPAGRGPALPPFSSVSRRYS